MCTALVIGDLHFKDSTAPLMHLFEERLCERMDALTASGVSITFIVLLGDTLDRFNDVKVTALCRAMKFVSNLLTRAPVYLLIGNHDRRNNDIFLTEEHPFVGWKHLSGLRVIDKPWKEEINGLSFLFAPYVHEGRFLESLEVVKLPTQGYQAIFAHQEFRNSVSPETGDVWPLNAPLVISGHIHDYRQLQSNVLYVGTPVQHSYGEGTDKSVSLFTFSKEGGYKQERIYLELPLRLTLKLQVSEIQGFVLPPKVSDLRLIIHCLASEKKAVMEMERVKEWGSLGIKVQCKTQQEVGVLLLSTSKDYRKSLAQAVGGDYKLRSLYQELIGPLPAGRVVLNIRKRQ